MTASMQWQKTLLTPQATMAEAIRVIDQAALRIALVVNEQGKLLGTITDGDIRRALIAHQAMTTRVTDFMFSQPAVARVDDSPQTVRQLMKNGRGILHLPLVDQQGCVVGLKTMQDLLLSPRYDNPVCLMAGGVGSRLHPLTLDTPKPLLEVGQKPIMETILQQFIAAGFHDFYLSIHYKAEMIKSHFGDGSRWGVRIRYLHETSPLGTAGALGLLPDDVPSLPLLVMNGDVLTQVDFSQLLPFHQQQGGVATLCVREYAMQVPYGVVEAEGQQVRRLVEKPRQKFFVNAGIYVLEPTVFQSLSGRQCIDMPTLLDVHIEQGDQVNVFPLHEYWLDIGQREEFEQAQRDVAAFPLHDKLS